MKTSQMACRQPENIIPVFDSMSPDDGNHHSKDATLDGSNAGQSMFQGSTAGTSLDIGWEDAISAVGQTAATTCSIKGTTTQSRRGADTPHRHQKNDGRSDDYHQVPFSQEAQGSRGCLHQEDPMADGLFQQSASRSMAQLEEPLLSFYLAAYCGQMPQLHTNKEPVGSADLQAAEMNAVGNPA